MPTPDNIPIPNRYISEVRSVTIEEILNNTLVQALMVKYGITYKIIDEAIHFTSLTDKELGAFYFYAMEVLAPRLGFKFWGDVSSEQMESENIDSYLSTHEQGGYEFREIFNYEVKKPWTIILMKFFFLYNGGKTMIASFNDERYSLYYGPKPVPPAEQPSV